MTLGKFLGSEEALEIRDFILAIAALSLGLIFLYNEKFFSFFLIALLVSTLAFLPRELIQKYVARTMNIKSRFKIWPVGALLSVLTPFMGFMLAVPGSSHLDHKYYRRFGTKLVDMNLKQEGLIAISGPLTNLAIGLLLLAFIENSIIVLLVQLNFLLAFVNLIPLGPLDGKKLILWKPLLWFVLFLISFIFIIIY